MYCLASFSLLHASSSECLDNSHFHLILQRRRSQSHSKTNATPTIASERQILVGLLCNFISPYLPLIHLPIYSQTRSAFLLSSMMKEKENQGGKNTKSAVKKYVVCFDTFSLSWLLPFFLRSLLDALSHNNTQPRHHLCQNNTCSTPSSSFLQTSCQILAFQQRG